MSERPKPDATHFDLERVRRNWERARIPPPVGPQPRFAEVPAPRDAIAVGRDLLGRVRALTKVELPEHAVMLAPFFTQAEGALGRIEAGSGNEDTAPARDLLVESCNDLEDLFEVLTGMGR